MINVNCKICVFPECKKQPTCNFEGNPALYCHQHKLNNMIDVANKKCAHQDCEIAPTYNYINKPGRLFCISHKLEGMINKTRKKCIIENCEGLPTYNIIGKKGSHCINHKLDGMINVISKKCIFENCKTMPSYNIPGNKPLFCFKHKLNEMIDVAHKLCTFENCKKIACYNYEKEKIALFCNEHKLGDMIDINSKRCKSEWCNTTVTKKYDGYCMFCFINLFPDKPVTRNYKTKEFAVVEYVKNNFADMNWIADKKVYDGCSKRRPDLFLDLGYQIIIIEIDENQHIDYDCSCENKRLMEISKDVNHRPIIFIRFNPDEYTSAENNITSCWGQNKNGIMVVKKSKVAEWEIRLDSLKEQILYWISPENKNEKTIEVVELFYDC